MSEIRMSTGTATWLNEPKRDSLAIGIWFAMLGGLLLLSVNGQSILMTIGFMLELTAAYSTFLLCGKQNCRTVVHVMPYVFALTGAAFLCLAPDFRNTVEATLAFLAVTALMHGFVVYGVRPTPVATEEAETEETAYAGAA
jgi:hypothetical protein